MQGKERADRQLLDAQALVGHLVPAGSMFAFLAAHRGELFADEEFAELIIAAVRADYEAINRYACAPGVRIRDDIRVLGARDDDRVDAEALRLWENHTAGAFELSLYDGGHFYLNEHIDPVAARVNADD